ncbi:MAG: CBS domain-containing protein [Phycisphaerales bacterium]|nr:CBS domain-containing protein [Phycisphaerales bacterium]
MTESERVDRFAAAYNRIDHALSDLLDEEPRRRRHSFAAKVRIASRRKKRFHRFADFLLEVGELRNAIVHNRTADEMFIAVPNEETVLDLERIEQRMLDPERVIPRFQRKVLTLSPDQSLADTWNLVQDSGYSRFPVYGKEGFVGLLTSNGFTRWCAGRLKGGRLEIDASAVSVAEVLAVDSRRDRVAFVSREALVDDVDDMYSQRGDAGRLEAVIITEHGKRHERPIGLICASDIAALED